MNSISYRESHKHKGADYHSTFTELPHRRMLWAFERKTLSGIVARHCRAPVRHLDFACGTGRVLGHLQSQVASSEGVDVSSSMLQVAKQSAPGATLHCMDITTQEAFGGRQFDLITAFRFFPNAEPELRLAALCKLSSLLSASGVLVFNNHMNRSSLQRRLLALRGYRPDDGMTREEVRELTRSAGLEIAAIHPLGILPLSDKLMIGPSAMWAGLEKLTGAIVRSEALAQDVLYVCRRAAA